MRTDYGPIDPLLIVTINGQKNCQKITTKMAKLVPNSVIDTKLRISKDSLDLV